MRIHFNKLSSQGLANGVQRHSPGHWQVTHGCGNMIATQSVSPNPLKFKVQCEEISTLLSTLNVDTFSTTFFISYYQKGQDFF